MEPKCRKITSFGRNSLTESSICVLSVPKSRSTHERSARAGFRFFPRPFPIPDPRQAVLELKCWQVKYLARNSLTRSPICLPSVPTSHSTLERSARAGFGFLLRPFSVPDPRRAVLEPKCRKVLCFGRNSLAGSLIRVPSVPISHSTLERSARASF